MQHDAELCTYPLVSVVIPVYNHQNYVEQALNSVFNQTYPNLEVIIIDDGSKDESPIRAQLCIEDWEKTALSKTVKRDIIFIKQPNQGAHTTINRGLTMAKGNFLTILNSDDYYHLERIQILVEQITKAKAQFAFSYVRGINDTNQFLPSNHWWPRWYEKTKTRLFRYPTVGFILLQENLAVSTGNLFFSKDLFHEVGPFKNLKLAHDLDFILRALTITEPLLIRENLYFYRLHRTNTQHQVKHLMKEELQEIHRTYLTLISSHPPKNHLAPSHWTWPLDFARLRLHLGMDRSLNSYISHFPAENQNGSQTKTTSIQRSSAFAWNGKPICLVSHDLSLSGAPKLLSDLALTLKQQGYTPTVIALQDGPMRIELEKEGIPVSAPSRFILKRMIHLLFLAIFKTKPLTIVNSMNSWPFVCLMALFHPFRTLKWYIHETSAPRTLDGRISFYLFKWFKLKNSRRFWFGSNNTKDAWDVFGLNGDILYWSGIPKQSMKENSSEPLKKILSVGTASARKGTYYLIDAFFYCLEKGLISHDITLTIVGFPNSKSPDFVGLEDLILRVATSKFKDNIQLIGTIAPEKLEQYYLNADLFIQSSILECLPISLLTAMSKGLPIITTNVNGCVEAIEHGFNGYVCLPYHRQSLVDAIVEVCHHPKKSRDMGLCALKTFNDRFSLEVTRSAILEKLEQF
jgi:glycosyltransferase involved in cell wall biosynthesis